MKRVLALLFLIGIIVVPGAVHAQTISNDISIDVIPLNPEPGATATLQATSYAMDLTQATLVWTYNNVVVARGTGKTSIAVIAPAAGATGVVSLSATGGGEVASTSIVLRPGSVDVLWEAVDAYTPPFYKGKALLPVNGLIRYTAIASAGAPKALSYAWTRNTSALQAESGFGKSSVLLKHNEFNPIETVAVTISGGSYAGTNTATVRPLNEPSILAYQNREGFIDYAHGYTTTVPFTQSGMVLHFEPYYFSIPRSITTDLSYDLKIDGQSVTPSRPNEVGLSRPATAGQSKLELAITTVAYSLQHAAQTFTLTFN